MTALLRGCPVRAPRVSSSAVGSSMPIPTRPRVRRRRTGSIFQTTSLESLAEGQQSGFADLGDAMDSGFERIEDLLGDVKEVVTQTHAARFPDVGAQMDEMSPRGFADVRFEKVHPASGAPTETRVEVTPRQGAPWPPLVVAPRAAPEAGCRAWDTIRTMCVGA